MSAKYKSSVDEGKEAEELFEWLAISRGYEVSKTSEEDDINRHVDFWIKKDEIVLGIDVKARKRSYRKSKSFDKIWTWIEFQNVGGNTGWVYGDADYIAFRSASKNLSFTLCHREELAALVEKLVPDTGELVGEAKLAKYKRYQRAKWNRKDIITRIEQKHLLTVKHFIWNG
jgi:hypothetical protein